MLASVMGKGTLRAISPKSHALVTLEVVGSHALVQQGSKGKKFEFIQSMLCLFCGLYKLTLYDAIFMKVMDNVYLYIEEKNLSKPNWFS